MTELTALRKELRQFRVLDPACGSGNFLYVAFREMSRLDLRIMLRLKEMVSASEFHKQAKLISGISPLQFFGLDNDPFGVELAKVTLMLAKKLAHDEAVAELFDNEGDYRKGVSELGFEGENALPLDNLDDNIRVGDAMFYAWPEVEAIVGNPPYQSKNKLQEELGRLPRASTRHTSRGGWARGLLRLLVPAGARPAEARSACRSRRHEYDSPKL